MAFCSKCGEDMKDAKFCATCGAPAGAQPEKGEPVAPTSDAAWDVQNNKVMGILAYIIFFIPLLTGDHKKSEFVKYHTNQGTVLFLASLILMVGWSIVTAVLGSIFAVTFLWGLLAILGIISGLLWLFPTVFAILGIINVCNGRMQPLPIIGKWTVIK